MTSQAPPRYVIHLTALRKVGAGQRNERTNPEPILQSAYATDRQAAEQIFRAWYALPTVKAGKQRVKIIEVAGRDTLADVRWTAPLITGAAQPLAA